MFIPYRDYKPNKSNTLFIRLAVSVPLKPFKLDYRD